MRAPGVWFPRQQGLRVVPRDSRKFRTSRVWPILARALAPESVSRLGDKEQRNGLTRINVSHPLRTAQQGAEIAPLVALAQTHYEIAAMFATKAATAA
jgi:hypothetical protein